MVSKLEILGEGMAISVMVKNSALEILQQKGILEKLVRCIGVLYGGECRAIARQLFSPRHSYSKSNLNCCP